MLLVVAACGALPRPFKPANKATAPNPLVEEATEAGVEVAAVTGTAGPMGRLLAESVAKQLRKHDIPAQALSLSSSSHVLTGRAGRNQDRPDLPHMVLIHWRLFDRFGNDKGGFTHGVKGTLWEWDYGAPNVLASVGEETSARVAKLVLGNRYVGLEPQQVATRRGVWVGPIKGAPGDGNAALARGIRLALGGAGLAVTTDPAKAGHHLTADVAVSAPEKGAQGVNIDWVVKDPSGHVLGHARQANAVPAGSLDGAWGQAAAYASAAAVKGIQGIINSTDKQALLPMTRKRGLSPSVRGADERRMPQPATPPSRHLPQVPGRAMPPPG